MPNRMNERFDEAYRHIKPYIKDARELHSMCSRCERYCGEMHDFSECREEWCFKFWLAYVYLKWLLSSDGY